MFCEECDGYVEVPSATGFTCYHCFADLPITMATAGVHFTDEEDVDDNE
jgi:hypothetical protein